MGIPYRRMMHRVRTVANCCPTCGREAELPGQIHLDLGSLECHRAGRVAILSRREALMLHKLLESWPRSVEYDALAEHIWRDVPVSATAEGRLPYNLLQVIANLLRHKLKLLGMTIPRATRYASAYRIHVGDLPETDLRIAS